MLETIASGAKAETSFLSTPRSMLPGSWACDSPRMFIEPPRQPMPLDGKQDKNLSIEIPRLEEQVAGTEQRDAAEENSMRGDTPSAMRHATPSAVRQETPMAAAEPEVPRDTRFECDYDKNPTELFLHLQRKEWDQAAKRADALAIEARCWVSRKEKHGKLRWRLLPLHAAIIFKAPEKVVETLLAAYPKGAQSKDDQGMLPLHLAFRHGSNEGTVNLLLVAFPQSVDTKDRKGRIPLVLAQASASPNRDAFVRALERGPTYYANAAAATERASVTTEQRAIFDAKLIEVEKNHQQDVSILKEEKKGLNESIELLQKELAKQKGATQVLVDHVNALESQLKSKGETERFLAVKAATLDTNLKEVHEESDHQIHALVAEIQQVKSANVKLHEDLAQLSEDNARQQEANARLHEDNVKLQDGNVKLQENNGMLQEENARLLEKEQEGPLDPEEFKYIKEKSQKQEKELKSLKMDWASAQARAAVLEAQLKSKIENEHELASQVSHLAGKLAESAADNSTSANMYSGRVHALEEEREKLRATVNDLGKKLLKVSHFMNKMTQKTQENTKRSTEEAKQKQAKLLADASNHEQLIRTALAERKQMAALLKKQEEEMERSALQHQEILEKLANLKKDNAEEDVEDDETIPFSNSLTEEMQEMMNNVLMGMPDQVPSTDSDLVDSVVESLGGSSSTTSSGSAERAAERAADMAAVRKVSIFERSVIQETLDSSSSDADEDPQKCLEEALRALELTRTRSVTEPRHDLKSMSEVSDATSLNYNPSDEESDAHKRGLGASEE